MTEDELNKEIGRWQEAIYKAIKEHTGADSEIDGGGCDSGDPLDLTLAEIAQGFEYMRQRVCDECNGDGWNYNAVEGRHPCACVEELEPYRMMVERADKLKIALDLILVVVDDLIHPDHEKVKEAKGILAELNTDSPKEPKCK